jgi:hypothetical protein
VHPYFPRPPTSRIRSLLASCTILLNDSVGSLFLALLWEEASLSAQWDLPNGPAILHRLRNCAPASPASQPPFPREEHERREHDEYDHHNAESVCPVPLSSRRTAACREQTERLTKPEPANGHNNTHNNCLQRPPQPPLASSPPLMLSSAATRPRAKRRHQHPHQHRRYRVRQ